jgi:hemolysin III
MTQTLEAAPVKSRPETEAEHVANAITHGIGAALSLAALVLLIVFSSMKGDTRRILTSTLYGLSLVALYLGSTCFHSVRTGKWRRWFRIWDHAAIYCLIAGNYTPFLIVMVRGGLGWTLFGVLWACAITGTIVKIFHIGKYDVLSTFLYVAMGWLGMFAIKSFIITVPHGGLVLLLIGGISYSIGVVFYLWERLLFSHAIWHLFVLGGSVCHFFAVFCYVIPT